jgi:hypothetical protein
MSGKEFQRGIEDLSVSAAEGKGLVKKDGLGHPSGLSRKMRCGACAYREKKVEQAPCSKRHPQPEQDSGSDAGQSGCRTAHHGVRTLRHRTDKEENSGAEYGQNYALTYASCHSVSPPPEIQNSC